MRLATWNVNSIRMRQEQLVRWLELRKFPEIVCLQETKVVDENFPIEVYKKLGYQSIFKGQKSYNGVAMLAKFPIHQFQFSNVILNKEARVLHVRVGELEIINAYVPNGQMPGSQKFVWKFEFLNELKNYIFEQLKTGSPLIVCGDINIAPQTIDVHDPIKYSGSIMFSEPERKIFADILKLGLHDVFREKYPNEKQFTWFDYLTDALIGNRGWRIDFILANDKALKLVEDVKIDQEPRAWNKPSDHCPVVVKINAQI